MLPAFVRKGLARHLLSGGQSIENDVIDRLIGLEVKKTSQSVGSTLAAARPTEWAEEHVWQEPGEIGHPMTGYKDLIGLFQHLDLPNGTVFAELGAGFGRAGFVIGLLYPQLRYLGYELVAPRVQAAQHAHAKLKLGERIQFHTSNLARWAPKPTDDADVYYVFCSFCEPTGRHVLEQLRQIAQRKSIRLILNIGMYGFEPEENPWLVRQNDHGIFSCYESC